MSKKKKLEEQKRQMELQKHRAPQYIYAKVGFNGVVPVAPPSQMIQLTPIIQPIAMVPYATQQQPLCTYIDEDYED